MDKVYIVSRHQGSYSDYVCDNICAFLEREKAEEYIEEIHKRLEFQKDILNKYMSFFQESGFKVKWPVFSNFANKTPSQAKTIIQEYLKELKEKSIEFLSPLYPNENFNDYEFSYNVLYSKTNNTEEGDYEIEELELK